MSSQFIYLASRSPRRRELLTQIGVRFDVLDVEVDETPRPGETAPDYTCRVARDKADAGWAARPAGATAPVLAADTEVVIDGTILGKPRDAADAAAMLARLSGRRHTVCSAVALRTATGTAVRVNETTVWFRPLAPDEIAAYVATGEPLDKAGAYGIQGRAGAFIERIDGSYSGVMGLPLCETAALLG